MCRVPTTCAGELNFHKLIQQHAQFCKYFSKIIVGDYAGQNSVHETMIVPHCGLQSAMMYDTCMRMRKMP